MTKRKATKPPPVNRSTETRNKIENLLRRFEHYVSVFQDQRPRNWSTQRKPVIDQLYEDLLYWKNRGELTQSQLDRFSNTDRLYDTKLRKLFPSQNQGHLSGTKRKASSSKKKKNDTPNDDASTTSTRSKKKITKIHDSATHVTPSTISQQDADDLETILSSGYGSNSRRSNRSRGSLSHSTELPDYDELQREETNTYTGQPKIFIEGINEIQKMTEESTRKRRDDEVEHKQHIENHHKRHKQHPQSTGATTTTDDDPDHLDEFFYPGMEHQQFTRGKDIWVGTKTRVFNVGNRTPGTRAINHPGFYTSTRKGRLLGKSDDDDETHSTRGKKKRVKFKIDDFFDDDEDRGNGEGTQF